MVSKHGVRIRNEFPNDEEFVKKHLEKYRKDLVELFFKQENLDEEERWLRMIELASIIHAKTEAAGLTEEQIRKDVNRALAELYGKDYEEE